MGRFTWTIVALIPLAQTTWADALPPPGQKRVPVDYLIETDKENKDYVFFAVIGVEADWSLRLDVKPGTPARVPGEKRGGRARAGSLIAVPAAAKKDYKTPAEFKAAAVAGKIEGIL